MKVLKIALNLILKKASLLMVRIVCSESYGQGYSRNFVVSRTKLARYRAEYDNVSTTTHFEVSSRVKQFVRHSLTEFRSLGALHEQYFFFQN